MPLIRPAIVDERAAPIDRHTRPESAVARLERGEYLLVTDSTATGHRIVEALWKRLGSRADRLPYRRVAVRLLERVEGHRSTLDGAGDNGFIAELYPERSSFVIPFIQMQALKHAWELYQEGVHLAVLGFRVHPFYGTYVPTRTSHLELFGTWLHRYPGPRHRAIDVGTGCGVLAFMLARAGFDSVLATEVNPNAVESVRRQIAKLDPPLPVRVEHTDLLGSDVDEVDLVVFNPPWVKGEVAEPLDAALVWDDEQLFSRFFDQAQARVSAEGRVVVVFSTIGTLVQPDVPHPLLNELELGRFRLVDRLQRRVKPTPGPDGKPRRTKEKVEIWEFEKLQTDL